MSRPGYITLGNDTCVDLIAIAIIAFVEEGDRGLLDIVATLEDDDGNTPPVDELVSAFMCETGRLLMPAPEGRAA